MHKFSYYIKKMGIALLLLGITFGLSSCVSIPSEPEYGSIYRPKPQHKSKKYYGPRRDIVHTVAPGETLWRVSKMYNVPMANILSANQMRRTDKLKMGDRIKVPRASDVQPIVSMIPSKKWQYIIIHHSATEEGDSLSFHKSHLDRGWDGLGYHFVIDNTTKGKQDGQIETSPRWLKQADGAHCKAADMNTKGIGICLVGNFNDQKVSRKQMNSLTFLVNKLSKYYKIPPKNILAHGHVHGASTDCPGKHFPWHDFKRKVR